MTIKKYLLASAWATGLLLQACSAGDAPKAPDAEASSTPVAQECRNGGDRLPETGMCKDAAIATLNLTAGDAPLLPEGCSWEIQETPMATDFLLYMAASCGGTTSKLTVGIGAHQAEITLESSALGAPVDEGQTPLVRVISSDPADPYANLLYFTKMAMEDPVEAENCVVRPANLEGWPEEAMVVDIKDAPAVDEDGPRSACGPYGFSGDSTQYWRVFDDFSWFFSLGQDAYQDVDMRSLTFIPAPAEN